MINNDDHWEKVQTLSDKIAKVVDGENSGIILVSLTVVLVDLFKHNIKPSEWDIMADRTAKSIKECLKDI